MDKFHRKTKVKTFEGKWFLINSAFEVTEMSSSGIWASFSLGCLPYDRKKASLLKYLFACKSWFIDVSPDLVYFSDWKEIKTKFSSRICDISRRNKPCTFCKIEPPLFWQWGCAHYSCYNVIQEIAYLIISRNRVLKLWKRTVLID